MNILSRAVGVPSQRENGEPTLRRAKRLWIKANGSDAEGRNYENLLNLTNPLPLTKTPGREWQHFNQF